VSTAHHVVLLGMMGVGKSTVGRLLATELARPYVDNDAEVERETGTQIADLFAARGEDEFRKIEQRVLAEALRSPIPSVIGPGGGVVTRAEARDVLRSGPFVVWLRARPDTLAERVGTGAGRPLLDGHDVLATLTTLARERAPLYEQVAGAIVDVDDLDADAVVAEVEALVRQRERHGEAAAR
jgi:shikimate kinase